MRMGVDLGGASSPEINFSLQLGFVRTDSYGEAKFDEGTNNAFLLVV